MILETLTQIEPYYPVSAEEPKELREELDKLFRFFVKHYEQDNIKDWKNKDIRKFIKWAWLSGYLFVIHDPDIKGGRRIVAAGIGLPFESPTTEMDLSQVRDDAEYIYAFSCCIHPEFSRKRLLFMLATMAQWRFKQAQFIYWQSHAKGNQKTVIIRIDELMNRLSKNIMKVSYGKK